MIVVKIGGSEGINYDFIVDDLAALVKEGQPLTRRSARGLSMRP